MKRAGELLSVFFNEEVLKKAKGYHDLFSSWKFIAGDQIGAHSCIVELERSILLIEADHPGWIQILQMRQRTLLNAVRRRFPDLSITGISFRLSRNSGVLVSHERESTEIDRSQSFEPAQQPTEDIPVDIQDEEIISEKNLYESIKDSEFKETLMRLEKSIAIKDN
ncbi:MAG: DUF721 domain-containing protein [Treponema sp.]|nr:DUF721 domain-containing protein [Treponema sp.]